MSTKSVSGNNINGSNINVMVADKDLLFCKRVSTLIKSQDSFDCIYESNSYEDTLIGVKRFKPDVLFLDQLLIHDAISEKIQELKGNSPACKLLINFRNIEIDFTIDYLLSGAVGVLAKNQNNKTILKAIACVSNGELWANRTMIAQILKDNWNQRLAPDILDNQYFISLTAREKTIAQMAAQGMNSKKIASQLAISVKTVRNQLTSIYSKLGVKNHIGLILLTKE
jgi:two-component system, NarL family, response regulator DegU